VNRGQRPTYTNRILPLDQHLLVTHGLHLITRLRKQTHKRLLDLLDERLLRKRATIETIRDQLKKPSLGLQLPVLSEALLFRTHISSGMAFLLEK
jgi:Transposase DDE domain